MADLAASSQPIDSPVSWCGCGPCRERVRLEEALFFLSGAGLDADEVEAERAAIGPCEGAGK